jgi:PhnB protein
MRTKLNPYISFKNNTREAMEFYRSVFGGKLVMNTFKEFHASMDPGEDDLIMHAQLDGKYGLTLMASDTPERMEYRPGTNFSISLSGDNRDELSAYFEKLSSGGAISMPLTDAPWGDAFGMCTDRYGVAWMVNISPLKS